MALIKCPECGRKVSDKREICPNCGMPIKEIIQKPEKKHRKTWIKYVIFVILLLILGGITYYSTSYRLKRAQEIQEKKDEEIYNTVVQNIEDCKYNTAIDTIEEEISTNNKDRLITYINDIVKDTQINSIDDVSIEELWQYEIYLKIIESIDINNSDTKELLCDYLNKALELENYSEYFSILKYYNSSDYEIHDSVIETAMGDGEINGSNLQLAISLLDSIDMSNYYTYGGYGISEVEVINSEEKACLYELLDYVYGDNSVNPDKTAEKLADLIVSYSEIIIKAVSISSEVQPIIESLPTL